MQVTAAILVKEGVVLLARRPPGDRLADFWELPGGKIEAGETPEECRTSPASSPRNSASRSW